MSYEVGAKIISKKPHACGGKVWLIERVGADIKIKCETCGKTMFLTVDQVKKMTKTYLSLGENNA